MKPKRKIKKTKKDRKKKCECCRKLIIPMGRQKFCPTCSLYIRELKHQISYYKSKVKKLTIKLYGTLNGTERIR